jgi:hypothetical protein
MMMSAAQRDPPGGDEEVTVDDVPAPSTSQTEKETRRRNR